MASTIKIKNGTGGASPSTLSQGELALNIDNGLMYFGSSSNAVRKLDTVLNLTASISGGIGGNISASGDVFGINADFIGTGSFDKGVIILDPQWGADLHRGWIIDKQTAYELNFAQAD